MKGVRKPSSTHPKNFNNMQITIPLENAADTSGHRNQAIQRGASVNVSDSASLLLDSIDQSHPNHKCGGGMKVATTTRGSYTSSKFGNTVPSSFDRSFEGSGSIHPTTDIGINQDQIRGRLTLPHLTNFQTKSLDIPNSQSSVFPNMFQGSFANASVDYMNQIKSLDVTPTQINEVNPSSENSSPIMMPRSSISIHVRKPTVKSSIHGK